jgi:hypothetical protein
VRLMRQRPVIGAALCMEAAVHAFLGPAAHSAEAPFRRGRSCDEHIYCISQAAQGRHRMRLPTYAFFLDLRKAYDTVSGGMACCASCGTWA